MSHRKKGPLSARHGVHVTLRLRAGLPSPEGPDPYSSGRWFDGWRGWARDSFWPAPAARAESWLVARGWRRLELIEARWRPP